MNQPVERAIETEIASHRKTKRNISNYNLYWALLSLLLFTSEQKNTTSYQKAERAGVATNMMCFQQKRRCAGEDTDTQKLRAVSPAGPYLAGLGILPPVSDDRPDWL